ncbi:MAG: phospholipase, partial [Pseudomonas sp.]
MMLKHLGDRMIPTENQGLSLGQLKKISPLQRVLVAAPQHYNLDNKWFCRQIGHKWIGKTTVDSSSLRQYISSVLDSPPGNGSPWSLSATCYSLGGPDRILDDLDKWFDPETSDWATKCNIINFDFIKNSKIVSHCRTANLKKASQKI